MERTKIEVFAGRSWSHTKIEQWGHHLQVISTILYFINHSFTRTRCAEKLPMHLDMGPAVEPISWWNQSDYEDLDAVARSVKFGALSNYTNSSSGIINLYNFKMDLFIFSNPTPIGMSVGSTRFVDPHGAHSCFRMDMAGPASPSAPENLLGILHIILNHSWYQCSPSGRHSFLTIKIMNTWVRVPLDGHRSDPPESCGSSGVPDSSFIADVLQR